MSSAHKSADDAMLLPHYTHNARVLYIRDASAADAAIARLFYSQASATPAPRSRRKQSQDTDLQNARVVGFDLEWRPTFVSGGPRNPVALIQIATADEVLLLQIKHMSEMPTKLVAFLNDGSIIKAGVNIHADCQRLYRDYQLSARGVLELSHLARGVDTARWPGRTCDPIGLARLTAAYTSCYLVKKGKVTKSNWERVLNDAQQTYAANDAHSGYAVASELISRLRAQQASFSRASSADADALDVFEPQPLSCYVCNLMQGSAIALDGSLWFAPAPPVPQPVAEVSNEESCDGDAVDESVDDVGSPSLEDEPDQVCQDDNSMFGSLLNSVTKRFSLRAYGS